jgi:hypothetical protein
VGFCDQGAQGVALARSMGLPSGDVVQVLEGLPDPADPYWTTVAGVCSRAACEAAYGLPASPTSARDLAVDAAYQDRLVLASNPNRASGAPLACCFPYPVTYTLRAAKHWLVTGSVTGYSHHVIPDPTATNRSNVKCVLSCDPTLRLRNSRAVGLDPFTPDATHPLPSFDANEGVFQNPQIQFVLWNPASPARACPTSGSGATGAACPLVRDMYFTISETGGFSTVEIPLSSAAVLPQSMRFVRGIEQLAISDGASQGLLLFNLDVLSTSAVRAFY